MKRAGFTLIEMVGVTIVVGMLLILSASLVHQTFAAHRDSLGHLRRMHLLERFIERWRTDVHAANEVKLEDDSLIVVRDDSELVYAVDGQMVTRTLRRAAQDIGRDQWQLPSACSVSWSLDDSGAVQLLRGRLEFDHDSDPSAIELETQVAETQVANKAVVGGRWGLDDIELVARVGVAKVSEGARR